MTTADRRIAAIATGQLGAFSREQAHVAGLSDRQLRGRVQSGFLAQNGPHGFRWAGAARSCAAALEALLPDIGPPAWAHGPTAAALHGMDGFTLRPPFHVVVPRQRNVRRVGAVVHTTQHVALLDLGRAQGVAVTSAARTLIDLARSETAERPTVALDSGLRDGKLSEDFLHRRIVALRSSGMYGIPGLLGVIEGVEASPGGHSWLEREFLRLVAAAGLPRPLTQQVLGRAGNKLVRVDCRFPGTPVVVELLGYRYHSTTDRLGRDAERLNALVLQGLRPYQFTYDQVVATPDDVLSTVRAALAGTAISGLRERK